MTYDAPTPDDLIARYPAFAAVAVPVLQRGIDDSARGVDRSWIEGDYAPARLALAAHFMAIAGVAGMAGGDVAGFAAAGVESFRSGAFSASLSAVRQAAGGGFASTPYGREYLRLLKLNRGGARVTGTAPPVGDRDAPMPWGGR